ncbi:MAG TPA: hypothetical protein VKX49_12840 [Bryobacteraceae bacterium]|nr:hypothetical protein [Bryobacteraceae bacterium]
MKPLHILLGVVVFWQLLVAVLAAADLSFRVPLREAVRNGLFLATALMGVIAGAFFAVRQLWIGLGLPPVLPR